MVDLLFEKWAPSPLKYKSSLVIQIQVAQKLSDYQGEKAFYYPQIVFLYPVEHQQWRSFDQIW